VLWREKQEWIFPDESHGLSATGTVYQARPVRCWTLLQGELASCQGCTPLSDLCASAIWSQRTASRVRLSQPAKATITRQRLARVRRVIYPIAVRRERRLFLIAIHVQKCKAGPTRDRSEWREVKEDLGRSLDRDGTHSIVLVVELSLPDEALAKSGPRPSALIAIVLVLVIDCGG
jgi:hypothetical protein